MGAVLPAVISLFPFTIAYAQDKSSEIDKVFSWTSPTAPGCACTVNEIGSVFQIAGGEGGLEVSLGHAPDKKIPFKTVARDTFQASQIFIHFVRDKQGKITAFEFSNPLVRKVKLTRLVDRV